VLPDSIRSIRNDHKEKAKLQASLNWTLGANGLRFSQSEEWDPEAASAGVRGEK